ncbi:MAG: hypothetical protein RR579_01680, partial [Eubacterium sp.]
SFSRNKSAGLTSRPHYDQFSAIEIPYVDRFACDWHRLSTTNPRPFYYNERSLFCQVANI